MVWYLIGGFLLGILFMALIGRMRNDGDLVVYIPDIADEPPYLCSEWKQPIQAVMSKKRVKLNVVIRQLNSQK